MFERVEVELKWVIDSDVTPCYWGDDWVILHNLEDSKASQLLYEETRNGSTPILDLQKWSKDIRPTHRLAWVLLWGLPLTAWEPEYMGKVVAKIGDMVEVHEMVEQRRRIDVAKILIRTKMRPGIQTELTVVIDGVESLLHVVEDMSGVGEMQRMKQTATWLPPSPFSTEPNSPATARVETLGVDSTCDFSDGIPNDGDGGYSINGKQPQSFQTCMDQWIQTNGRRCLDRSFTDIADVDHPQDDNTFSNNYTTVEAVVPNKINNGQTLKRNALNVMFQGDRRDIILLDEKPPSRPLGTQEGQQSYPLEETCVGVARVSEGQQEK